jgi:hypothetical protein
MQNNMYIKRAEYVEVNIPTGNTKQQIYFPDLPNLRTSKIFGIEVYSADTAPITYTGATNQALADIENTMLSLYFEGGDFIQVPLISLYRNNSTTFYGEIPMLAGQVIVWAKSYVWMSGTIGNFANKNFLFSVYYSKNNI